jgi:hypothetical protein
MVSDKILERGHRVIESEGWRLYLRFSQKFRPPITGGKVVNSEVVTNYFNFESLIRFDIIEERGRFRANRYLLMMSLPLEFYIPAEF